MNITPQSIYIIVPAIKERTNEFTLEDQKGNVLSYLERKDNMVVMTVEEFSAIMMEGMGQSYGMCYTGNDVSSARRQSQEYIDNLLK